MSMEQTLFPPTSLKRCKAARFWGSALLGYGLIASVHASQLITFDVPGADLTPGDQNGTLVASINERGFIAGTYYDTSNAGHGFLRSPDGKVTTFDAPGASLTAGGTAVNGMNAEGAIVGYFIDANVAIHGFVRSPEGKFTTINAPGACPQSANAGCHGTGAWSINESGVIVGAYEDTSGNFVAHTFIRTPEGKFTTFAVPGSSMQAGQGTLTAYNTGLNEEGFITGVYYDANNTFHGYLRSPEGIFADFEASGASLTIPYGGTTPQSLNDAGAVTGYYLDSNDVFHGFLRKPEGKIINFDAPGADLNAGDFNGTFPADINQDAKITGSYIDTTNVFHGFIRSQGGHFTAINVPGAGTGASQGTFPISTSEEGVTAGYYVDANGTYHGFVRLPNDE